MAVLARKCQRCGDAVVDGMHSDLYGQQRCLRVLDVEAHRGGQEPAVAVVARPQDMAHERFNRAMMGRWYLRTQRLKRVGDMFEAEEEEQKEGDRGDGDGCSVGWARLAQLDGCVCAECMKEVFREYDRRLSDHKRFIDEYSAALKHESPQHVVSLWETDVLEEEETRLDAALEAVNQELLQLEEEEERLEKEEATLREAQRLKELQILAACDAQHFANQDLCSLVASVRSLNTRLASARAARVHEDLFLIRQDDQFATINGLRVGSLPSIQVSWEEINAGLGECCLLLFACASKMNFNFKTFRPVPQSECSFMQRVSNSELIPLSGSLRSTVFSSSFNSALGALLTATDELAQVLFKSSGAKPRYRVTGDMIGDEKDQWYSIKRPIGDSPKWVRALLYLVSNLKMVLGMSAHANRGSAPSSPSSSSLASSK